MYNAEPNRHYNPTHSVYRPAHSAECSQYNIKSNVFQCSIQCSAQRSTLKTLMKEACFSDILPNALPAEHSTPCVFRMFCRMFCQQSIENNVFRIFCRMFCFKIVTLWFQSNVLLNVDCCSRLLCQLHVYIIMNIQKRKVGLYMYVRVSITCISMCHMCIVVRYI